MPVEIKPWYFPGTVCSLGQVMKDVYILIFD